MDEKAYEAWMARWDAHDPVGTMIREAFEQGRCTIRDASTEPAPQPAPDEDADKAPHQEGDTSPAQA